ncbi:TlpA family protein disulfide reductase [Patescibacteria group bacterium]|nr:TlpA family protein disulfide reductase [Patescibacteria group bacterium]
MKKIIILVGVLIVLGVGAATFLRNSGSPAMQPGEEASLDKAPDFSLKDYQGNTVSLADFAGVPLVINSWAAWCPFCIDELPDFAAVQKELGDKVVIIAIDRAESLATSKRYTDDLEVTNDLVFLLDPGDSFYRSIGGFSMPETIFVDREGNIRDHKRGPMDVEEIRERIQKIL